MKSDELIKVYNDAANKCYREFGEIPCQEFSAKCLQAVYAKGIEDAAIAATKIDRADAVNLALDIRQSDNIENISRKGILLLVDAVLTMDKAIRAPGD